MAMRPSNFDNCLRRMDTNICESVGSPLDMENEFDEWLGRVGTDMHESVAAATDIEEDLFVFKQQVFAQIAAIAHREGSDAPDRAVRSVLDDPGVVERYTHADLLPELLWGSRRVPLAGVSNVKHQRRSRRDRSVKRDDKSRDRIVRTYPNPGRIHVSIRLLIVSMYAGIGIAVGVAFAEAQVVLAAVLSAGLVGLAIPAASSTAARSISRLAYSRTAGRLRRSRRNENTQKLSKSKQECHNHVTNSRPADDREDQSECHTPHGANLAVSP